MQRLDRDSVEGSMFHDGSGCAIWTDDELEGLIEPSICAVGKEELSKSFMGCLWTGVVETDNECRRFNGLDRHLILIIEY